MKRLPALLALAVLPAGAQQVSLHGTLGDKALLVIDGGAPHMLAAGQSRQGVKLLTVDGEQARVEVGGEPLLLRVTDTPLQLQHPPPASRHTVTLYANAAGHFLARGSINGQPVQFMADTGATLVALDQEQADRLRLDWHDGQQIDLHTANGAVTGSLVKLRQLRLGELLFHDVDAVVTPMAMPVVLLGNNVLNRVHMQRSGSQMLLTRP